MDRQTIRTYNTLANEYDQETIDFWQRFPKKILTQFARKLKTSSSILDIGSGPGRDGMLLKYLGFKIICIDASSKMVKLCKEKGLIAKKADFMSLPFTDLYFDGIWAYTSLLHIPKKDFIKALQESLRVLKPKGIFGLGLIEGDAEGYKTSSGVNKPRYFSYFQRSELEAYFRELNLKVLYFEQFKPGSKNYLNYILQKN